MPKVTAPRVLGVRKVCSYVINKLNLEQRPGMKPEDLVEILCNGTALDPGMSLATVSTFEPKTLNPKLLTLDSKP
jgi:hypothetical protein